MEWQEPSARAIGTEATEAGGERGVEGARRV